MSFKMLPDAVEVMAARVCNHRDPDVGLTGSCPDCTQAMTEALDALMDANYGLTWPAREIDPNLGDARPRRFVLKRKEDPTGISGIGVVAFGTEWPDRSVSLCWNTAWRSLVCYPQGMRAVQEIHGHEGKTDIVWLDGFDGHEIRVEE